MKIDKMKQSEIENLMANLSRSFEGAKIREHNPALAYGFLKQGVESILGAAKGDLKYKMLRLIK